MSMFQILTQEAWVEVMKECMLAAKGYSVFVAVFFLCFHLFASVVSKAEVGYHRLLKTGESCIHCAWHPISVKRLREPSNEEKNSKSKTDLALYLREKFVTSLA